MTQCDVTHSRAMEDQASFASWGLHRAATNRKSTTMTKIALFASAALLATTLLAGTASVSPASAGSLDFLSNQNYMRCLQYFSIRAHGDAAAYDQGRRFCNRQYFPGRPGGQY